MRLFTLEPVKTPIVGSVTPLVAAKVYFAVDGAVHFHQTVRLVLTFANCSGAATPGSPVSVVASSVVASVDAAVSVIAFAKLSLSGGEPAAEKVTAKASTHATTSPASARPAGRSRARMLCLFFIVCGRRTPRA